MCHPTRACHTSIDTKSTLKRKRSKSIVKIWVKVLLVTLVVAIPAFLTGPIIWPPAEHSPAPTAGQLPFFLFLAAFESITLGLGVSFLLFGMPVVRRISAGSKLKAWAMYLSIGWLMVSWWPHDNLHLHNGMDLQGLLYIEYGFHLTLMIAGIVLGYSFLSLLTEREAAPMTLAGGEDAVDESPARP
jgi:hypothetical protein